MKSAPPIALTLSPWTGRKDAKTLTVDREDTEAAIRAAHATAADSAMGATATAAARSEAGDRFRSNISDPA